MTHLLKKIMFICLPMSLTQAMEDKRVDQDPVATIKKTLHKIYEKRVILDRVFHVQSIFHFYIQSAFLIVPLFRQAFFYKTPKVSQFIPCFLTYSALDYWINKREYDYFQNNVLTLNDYQNQLTQGLVPSFWKQRMNGVSEQEEWLYLKAAGAMGFAVGAFPQPRINLRMLGVAGIALTALSNYYVLDWSSRLGRRVKDVEALYLEKNKLNE